MHHERLGYHLRRESSTWTVAPVCINPLQRFCEEGVAWKHLRHPNVLPLLGVTIGERKLMMVSEWMGNGNINEFIEKNRGVNRTALVRVELGSNGILADCLSSWLVSRMG